MKIGEIAQRSGVSSSIIRYYEHRGVLPCAVRDVYGYRDYGEPELARVRFVTSARKMGCSFDEIHALIEMQDKHHIPSSQLLDMMSRKIAEIDNEIERLQEVQAILKRLHTNGLTIAEVKPAHVTLESNPDQSPT